MNSSEATDDKINVCRVPVHDEGGNGSFADLAESPQCPVPLSK